MDPTIDEMCDHELEDLEPGSVLDSRCIEPETVKGHGV